MKLAIDYKGAVVTVEAETRLDLSGLNAFLDTLTQSAPAQATGNWTAVIVNKKPAVKRGRGRPRGAKNKAK